MTTLAVISRAPGGGTRPAPIRTIFPFSITITPRSIVPFVAV